MPELDPNARWGSRVVLLAVMTLALSLLSVPALAHSDLVSSSPGQGESLGQPPRTVVLEFNEDVIGEFTKMQLTPGEQRPAQALTARVQGNRVSARVPTDALESGRPGTWTLSYRVVSADGHPISGEIDFTVGELPSATPPPATTNPEGAPTPSADQSSPADADEDAGGGGTTLAAIIGAVVLLLLLAAVFRLTRRVRREGDEE